jgi:hypothetical protein
MSKKAVVTLAIVAPILVLAVLVGSQAAKPKIEGDTITKTFSQGQPCASVTIPLKLAEGARASDVSETLFAALKAVKGMNSATLNVKTSSIEAGFCESSADEAAIRAALLPTGLVAEAAAAPAEPLQ